MEYAMAMTLKADIARASRANGVSKPVDLVHLSAQTFGDSALEAEVLTLFLSQSAVYFHAWRRATTQDARRRAAHTLKGAARSIGAWELADIAGAAELPGFQREAELAAELDRVAEYIRAIV